MVPCVIAAFLATSLGIWLRSWWFRSSIWWHCTPYHNTGWVFHSCSCIPNFETCTNSSTNFLFTCAKLLDCWFIRENNFYPLLFTPISRFIRKYHFFSLHSLSQSWFFHWFMRFETKFVHQTSTYSGAMNIRTFQKQRWPYLLTRTRRRANRNSLNQMVITWGSFPWSSTSLCIHIRATDFEFHNCLMHSCFATLHIFTNQTFWLSFFVQNYNLSTFYLTERGFFLPIFRAQKSDRNELTAIVSLIMMQKDDAIS